MTHCKLILFFVVMFCLNLSITAFASSGTRLYAEKVGGMRRETVCVPIYIDTTQQISGATFDILFDQQALDLQEVVLGDDLPSHLVTVNPDYKVDTIRLSIAGSDDFTGTVQVCVLQFDIKQNAPLAPSSILFEQVAFYDETISKTEVHTENGAVDVQYVALSIQNTEALSGQAVRVDVVIDGSAVSSGGRVAMHYNTVKMKSVSIVPGTLLNNAFFESNEAAPGTLLITWANSVPLTESGVLCSITFLMEKNITEPTEITFGDTVIYDSNSENIAFTTINGRITVIQPSADSPKLWIVGGGIDRDTKESVIAVVLENSGVVSGGELKLSYPTTGCSLLRYTLAEGSNFSGSTVNDEKLGELHFSWASASANTASETLLLLTFSVDGAIDEALTIHSAQLWDENIAPTANIDIRNGKFVSETMAFQAPTIAEADIVTSANHTAISLSLDIAHAQQGSITTEDTFQLIVVFYEGGKMQMAQIERESPQFDANGIADLDISAHYNGSADFVKILLMQDGMYAPLSAETAFIVE